MKLDAVITRITQNPHGFRKTVIEILFRIINEQDDLDSCTCIRESYTILNGDVGKFERNILEPLIGPKIVPEKIELSDLEGSFCQIEQVNGKVRILKKLKSKEPAFRYPFLKTCSI